MNGRGRPRYAVDRYVAVVGHAPVGRRDPRLDDLACILIVNSDDRHADSCRDKAGLDRERADAGQHVAAIRRRVDRLLPNFHLREEIVYIRSRRCRRADDRDLAGQRIAAADPVDLQLMS